MQISREIQEISQETIKRNSRNPIMRKLGKFESLKRYSRDHKLRFKRSSKEAQMYLKRRLRMGKYLDTFYDPEIFVNLTFP